MARGPPQPRSRSAARAFATCGALALASRALATPGLASVKRTPTASHCPLNEGARVALNTTAAWPATAPPLTAPAHAVWVTVFADAPVLRPASSDMTRPNKMGVASPAAASRAAPCAAAPSAPAHCVPAPFFGRLFDAPAPTTPATSFAGRRGADAFPPIKSSSSPSSAAVELFSTSHSPADAASVVAAVPVYAQPGALLPTLVSLTDCGVVSLMQTPMTAADFAAAIASSSVVPPPLKSSPSPSSATVELFSTSHSPADAAFVVAAVPLYAQPGALLPTLVSLTDCGVVSLMQTPVTAAAAAAAIASSPVVPLPFRSSPSPSSAAVELFSTAHSPADAAFVVAAAPVMSSGLATFSADVGAVLTAPASMEGSCGSGLG